MFGLGTKEIVIIAIIFIILFGPKKIPELTKSLVDSIKHVRGAFSSASNEEKLDAKKKS